MTAIAASLALLAATREEIKAKLAEVYAYRDRAISLGSKETPTEFRIHADDLRLQTSQMKALVRRVYTDLQEGVPERDEAENELQEAVYSSGFAAQEAKTLLDRLGGHKDKV